jgi:hypothetical protein
MNSLTIENVSASEALELKHELAQSGLVIVQDYTWQYHPVKYNHDWSTHPLEKSRVVFIFGDPALASFYRLKWTK